MIAPSTCAACEFCDGTGQWPDPVDGSDPCPACEGRGTVGASADPIEDCTPPLWRLDAIRAALATLSTPERQHLYEELHRVWGCRIYRP